MNIKTKLLPYSLQFFLFVVIVFSGFKNDTQQKDFKGPEYSDNYINIWTSVNYEKWKRYYAVDYFKCIGLGKKKAPIIIENKTQ